MQFLGKRMKLKVLSEISRTWEDKYCVFSQIQNLDINLHIHVWCVWEGMERPKGRGAWGREMIYVT